MTPKPLCRFAILLLAAGLGVGAAAEKKKESKDEAPDTRPNLILIIADDLGWNDCEPYGNPVVRTPNLMRLAKSGMRFDNAFVTISSCSPSRASIVTGRYPHNTDAEELH